MVPSDNSGEKLLDVSIFSVDDTIFDQTIENMHWSPPKLFLQAGPPNNFQCVFVHEDTDYRAEAQLSATLTGRELKEKIRTSFFYHVFVHTPKDDPSFPAIVSEEWLDLSTG